ncbi:hypothetical protein KR51_00013760 [Rubidibacter lacunae KORDI 51-2]|uniref:Uncharacterized protein n=2 Tax=Rubidibacter TaxID=582491 RepID=U5DK30_9CHRO|nr:hypothetical protein KR51_00013760 [Rubidibacter lacunae KORDI 51-2]
MENSNHRQLLDQLDGLAAAAARTRAQIAAEEAEHAFRILLRDRFEREMKEQAEQTYQRLLSDTQQFVEQAAQMSAQRSLELEERTIAHAPAFSVATPQFASFGSVLDAERQRQNGMAQLVGQTPQEQDIVAAASMGMTEAEIAAEVLGDESPDTVARVRGVLRDRLTDCIPAAD